MGSLYIVCFTIVEKTSKVKIIQKHQGDQVLIIGCYNAAEEIQKCDFDFFCILKRWVLLKIDGRFL